MVESTDVRTAVVGVVGAGFMGHQIALQAAMHELDVWMVDSSESALQHALEEQESELWGRVDAGNLSEVAKQEISSRIHCAARIDATGASFDLVVEAVPERLELKRQVFAELDRACPERTILATNSSSIRISAIEDVTGRRDRVLNMHFLMPVWDRPVVELMRGTATSSETLDRVCTMAETMGLVPLIVRKESTGFIFNRVWRAIKKECLTVVDEGVASFEDVDRAWMIAMSQPEGPFGIMDRIGLDVVRDIENVYYLESGDPAEAPPRALLDRVERGDLGVKTGRGFYSYPAPAYEEARFLKPGQDQRSREERRDDG